MNNISITGLINWLRCKDTTPQRAGEEVWEALRTSSQENLKKKFREEKLEWKGLKRAFPDRWKKWILVEIDSRKTFVIRWLCVSLSIITEKETSEWNRMNLKCGATKRVSWHSCIFRIWIKGVPSRNYGGGYTVACRWWTNWSMPLTIRLAGVFPPGRYGLLSIIWASLKRFR